LDVSPETVRQIEMRSIRKLRQHAGSLQDFIDA
jgi:DNA-directed RNA polymerase sigma subunit (sigma70/sigma32)